MLSPPSDGSDTRSDSTLYLQFLGVVLRLSFQITGFFVSETKWYLQDAVIELSEHGIVLIVEESGCLQAKVYLKREVL